MLDILNGSKMHWLDGRFLLRKTRNDGWQERDMTVRRTEKQ
jgi:hypothetical protein